MKLNQGGNQQCERDKETNRDREILRKEKATKAKHPRHHDHYLKLARGVRFENLQRYQNGQKRYGRLNAFESIVAEKDCTERQSHENQFQTSRAKPVTSWLHPEFQHEREKKKKRHPACERAKQRGKCEQQRGGEPKQRPAWDSGISPLLCASAVPAVAHAPSLPGNKLKARRHR